MAKFYLWGVIASPYLLKMQSLLAFSGHKWERWPEQGGRLAATATVLRLQLAKRLGKVQRYPASPSALDEYPSVPFYWEDRGNFHYDSSSLALQLDHHPARVQYNRPTLIPDDPQQAFVCQLIDEAFDEFGLYMVHHMRWVGSARTTPMGGMTAREMRSVLPPGAGSAMARSLPRRQVRRCPYLFSVAAEGFSCGVSAALTPPSRDGFPATHELLDHTWCEYLAAMEHVLAQQPYLLGQRFTLADASAYGQLGMNLVDGDATKRLRQLAPRTYAWLCAIRDGAHEDSDGPLALTPALQPLLDIIQSTFVSLMKQNEAAYRQALADGETLFNEAAFDQGRALYDGRLLQWPFRAVVKTFQVQVWRDLQEQWRGLTQTEREALEQRGLSGFSPAVDSDATPG